MSLFDDCDPEPEPGYKPGQPRATRGFTKPEQQQGIVDLKEAIASRDTFVLARTMALSLYRLGAEPLNKLAVDMLKHLEGMV